METLSTFDLIVLVIFVIIIAIPIGFSIASVLIDLWNRLRGR